MASKPPSDRNRFTIAIICALRVEFNAVCHMFDKFWDDREDVGGYGKAPGDTNYYTTGRIGNYNVVLALLPCMGNSSAASLAASMRSSYGCVRLALVVGVCGAVPQSEDRADVLLGDVIISNSIVQYDFQRQNPDRAVRKDTIEDSLGRPNRDIRGLVALLGTDREREKLEARAANYLKDLQAKAALKGHKQKYSYPGTAKDKLFKPANRHKHQLDPTCTTCRMCLEDEDQVCDSAETSSCLHLGCDKAGVIPRNRLAKMEEQEKAGGAVMKQPTIHIGSIASGGTVMKSATHRDEIAKRDNVIAFEMEGAGVWDEFPCIVVKGVCDYADSHKHKDWQDFAAAMAAATAKAILDRYTQIDESASVSQTLPVEGSDGAIQDSQSMAHSASSFRAQGLYDKAYKYCFNALELRQRVLGDEHRDTIGSRADLAAILHDQRNLIKAKWYGVIALYERNKVLGEAHPDTLESRAVLANIENSLGNFDQSLRLRQQVLALRHSTLGQENPDTIRSMTDLASSYRVKGEFVKARELCETAHDLRVDALGETHRDTMRCKVDLAEILHDLRNSRKARDIARTALTQQEEVLGNDHHDTISTREVLANIQRSLGGV